MIEDQVSPKKCGHTRGKQVISRAEAGMKIRAAVEAASKVDILIMARTDARKGLRRKQVSAAAAGGQNDCRALAHALAPEKPKYACSRAPTFGRWRVTARAKPIVSATAKSDEPP